MKQILISLFVLLSFLFKSVQAQECYDVLASHSGFNNFYDSNLQNKACDLTQKTIEASVTETMFVGGADLYPPMSFVDETEGFEFVYDQIFQQEVAVHTAYLFFAKEFSREGNVRLKMELVLPSRDLFQQWNAIDREGIKNYLGNLLEEELAEDTNSPHRVKLAEIRVMEELTKLIEDLIDGNFSLGENSLELAGFEAIELEPGLDVILEDNPALRNTKESEKSSTSEDYILTSIQLDDGISNPVELEELIPHEISLYDLFHLSGVIITSSDLDSLQEDSGPANTLFNNPGNGHDFVVWFHYSLNPEFNRFLFFKINVSEDLAEEIVDAEFVEEMQNWGMDLELPGYKGDIEHIQEKSRSEWKWGYALLENYLVEWYGEGGDIDCPENTDCVSPELYGAAIGCGVFDGILASVKAIWDLGKGVGNVFGGVIQKSSAYFTELIRYGIKERSLWKMHQKFTGDAIHAMKSAVAKVVSLWNTLSNLDLSKFKPFLDQIKLAITEWLGTLTSYTLDGGYELGKLVFDLVFTVATLGAGSGAVGAKFLSKFVKLLDKVEGSAFYHTLKELLDQSWALTQKGSAMAAKFYRCRILGRGCFVKDTPVLMSRNSFRSVATGIALATMPLATPIQDIQVDDLVKSYHHARLEYQYTDLELASIGEDKYLNSLIDVVDIYMPKWQDYDYLDITPETWQIGKLIIEEVNGSVIEIEANRPKQWFEDYNLIQKGDRAFIYIEDFGVADYALLQSIRATEIDTRRLILNEAGIVDRPVITTYKRKVNEISDYLFSNGYVISCTPNHPFYSIDRQSYVPVGELSVGEKILTSGEREIKFIKGNSRVIREHVYNLEVWREHNYFVGFEESEDFVLVHNICWKEVDDFFKLPIADRKKMITDSYNSWYPQIFHDRSFLEGVIRKTKFSDWNHTYDISKTFEAIDFYKKRPGSNLNIVSSMKTTKVTEFNLWWNSNPIQNNIAKLQNNFGASRGITANSKTIKYDKVRLDIFVPKIQLDAGKYSDWINKLKSKKFYDPDGNDITEKFEFFIESIDDNL